MKRTLYILLSLVCMLSACSKDEGGFVKDEFGRISQTVTIPSGMPDNIAVFTNRWNQSAEDQYYTGVQTGVPASVRPDGTYGFTFNAVEEAGAYNYFFLSPYKSTLTRSIYEGNSVVKARLFSVQYPSAEGIDANYDYKIGVNAENVGPGEKITCQEWKSIVSKFCLNLSDPENILEGNNLSAVTLKFDESADANVAGMFMTRHSSKIEECGFIGVDQNACGKGISLLYPSGLQPVSGIYPLHFATLPCSVAAGTKGVLSVSTPAKTVSFEFTLDSELLLESDAQMSMTIDRTRPEFTEKATQIQFFTSLQTNTIPLAQTTAAGETYKWGFSSCARYKDEYGLPVALKMVQNSSISLPHPEGKIITSLKVYTHEASYNSPLNDSYFILKNMGKPQQTLPCGHYNSSLYDGGCYEFAGLDDKMSKLSLAVEFSDEGVHHMIPISAVLMELENGEYKEDTSGEIDYYELYKNGDEIVIGDMTISLAKNGEAKLIKPSNLTYANMNDGGVYILDDSEGQTAFPDFGTTATTKTIASKDNLILIGRYGNSGIQTCLKHCELRMNSPYAVTFFNLKLSYVPANNTSSQYAFARNSNDANHSTLRFVDCYMDYSTLVGTKTGYYLVFASNGANGYFENVIIDNCIVKMTSETGKTPVIYYNNKSRSGGTFVDEKITVRNSVICTAAPMNGYLIWSGNDRSYPTPFLSVDVQNCTFAGFHNEKGIFRASELQSLKVRNNVFYSETTASTYLWLIYSGTATEGNYLLNDNRLYNLADASKWKLYLQDNKIAPAESGNEMFSGVPFAAGYDISAGYVPVDPALVGTGVGASYETKRYITKPAVKE